MLEFVDAQEMHEQYPDTFEAPTKEELVGIKKGMFVKVSHNNERFWVKVTRVSKKGVITGQVWNDIGFTKHPFKFKDRIVFETRHVYSIDKE